MTALKYSGWIAHNATPDSTCPPDAVGKRGQVLKANETIIEAESKPPRGLEGWCWDCPMSASRIVFWRALIEPVRGEIALYGNSDRGRFWSIMHRSDDTHRLSLTIIDGALIPGEYIGPDGATIVVGVV